jgi:putative transposase
MMANRSHALVVSDVGMFEFRRQLEDKAAMRGCQVRVADRFSPSSKRRDPCGFVNRDLSREPEWRCPNCGVLHDRDHNASWNLELAAVDSPLLRDTVPHPDMCGRAESSLAAASLPVTPGRSVTLCGAEGSDGRLAPVVQPSAGKQKPEQTYLSIFRGTEHPQLGWF